MENEIDHNAKIIWDYMLMHHKLKPMDAIFGLGTHDVSVATRASELFLGGYGKILIFAGDSGAKYDKVVHFEKPEAEVFADVAVACGVPREKIIIENKSTNTQENIEFVRDVLRERGISVNSFLLVQKPYMERRAYASFMNFWPGIDCIVTSPQISYEDYKIQAEENNKDLIGALVGDLQRIKEYPKRGFQIPQDIPEDVWKAYERLVELGFTRRLIKD
jgi:uncharacterized SAM-binding protein YcdF (DUF218 family)